MKLRLVSDLHTEFLYAEQHRIGEHIEKFVLPILPDDKNTVLILAGDIGSMHKPSILYKTLEYLCTRFKHIFYIPGNHEYYGGSLRYTGEELKIACLAYTNLTFCEQGNFAFGDQKFVLATLWSDFENENETSMFNCSVLMNDYRHIGGYERGLQSAPVDMLAIHKDTMEFLKQVIQVNDIVVTHHLPSWKSIPNEYKYGRHAAVNGAYASNLDDLIIDKKPKLWLHGHTHDSNDYLIDHTRIISNPVGYKDHENPRYQKDLVLEV